MVQWQQKTVVITGGSAGLGKELALAFLQRQATVIVVARDIDRLDNLKRTSDDRLHTYACDVTNDESVDELMTRLNADFDKIDVWVNNVGRSDRGEARNTDVAEFEKSLQINFLSAVRCTNAILPLLLESRGKLINIGSLACKSGGMNIGSYPVAKHALAAYSQQLRMELAADCVGVLLVCPGPVDRREPRTETAQYNVSDSLTVAATGSAGGGVRLKLIDPQRLAKQIIHACEKNKLELVVPRRAKLLFAISQLCPRLGDWVLRKKTNTKS
ncbi:SDR family NAD(P)-dependent oxidoreductase [Pirellulaceae bacterium]|jgi:short-subunit dehydrogenase|nr:SDR family NAD(P)-dependent oxidoreductase [Pirellulaceae bacterium]